MVRWLLALMLLLSLSAVGSGVAEAQPLPAQSATVRAVPAVADEESEGDSDAAEDDGAEEETEQEEADKDDPEEDGGAAEQAHKQPASEAKSDASAEESSEKEETEEKSANKQDKKDKAVSTSSAEKKSKDASAKTDEKSADAKNAEAKKAETHKVALKDLKIQVESDAVFVAEDSEEVALRPESWSNFKVLEAVPHGARVHKGDVLVKFDPKDIDQQLEEKSLALRIGEIALLEAEEEFPRLEKSIDLNYEEAERTYKEAQDEQERFSKTMRGLSEKMAEYMLKSAQQDYDNAAEELTQLEKMYEADELTEETEEIVLKRQKFQVEAAKFYLEYSKVNHEYTMTISIPRRAESLQTGVEMAKIEFERAKMAKSLGMNEQRYQLQQLREARTKALADFAKLEADRQLMTIKAPADGIAYYGRCVSGRWVEVSSLESKLIPYGTVTPNSVVMTVVKDRPMYVETSIGEKELPAIAEKQSVKVALAADDEVELAGKVKVVGDIPGAGNKFSVRIDVENGDAPAWLMPGMTGKAKITTYEVKDAVVIPADLVQSDENDPKTKYVMVQVQGKDKPVRREIKLGKAKDKEVEVLVGLKKGDEIVKGGKDDSENDKSEKQKSDEKQKPNADVSKDKKPAETE